MSRRVLLSWSSGKDSAWTMQVLREDPDVEIAGLLTTVNTTHARVAMHSTRCAILEAQADAAGLPLHVIPLPWPCSNDVYERAMRAAIESARQSGVTHIAFGDLFLEDIRAYRIKQLEGSGLQPLFPIWHEPTGPLARRMIDAGVEAFLTCVDPKKLPRSFAGRKFDHAFLNDLPEGVDPCGENGEFHTCVLAGPMFCQPVPAALGEVVERDGFYFADLVSYVPMGDGQQAANFALPPTAAGADAERAAGDARTLDARNARMKTSVNAASVAMRSYLSSHHLWTAHHFARLAEGIENDFSGSVRFDIRHRSYVVGAVLDSVAFSEAAVNELFQDVADGHRSYVAVLDQRTCSAMQAYWRESRGRASILEKYQTALGLAGREPLAVGAAPFQSAALVIQLRNLLVHFRPETVSADSARKVESRLKTRFPENVLMAGCGNPFFPDKCLGAGCAAWSINSLKALADEAFRRLAMAPNYQRVGWDDDGAPTQKSGA